MKTHTVVGGGGVNLHVREWGKADGPTILFIHGWSQNHLCWRKQYESDLANDFRLVALDLRGHGMSGPAATNAGYTESRPWADDIACIIDQLRLARPVLVGWSYGGFVICDYVRIHGQDAIAGIAFAGGAVTLDTAAFGSLIGPGFLEHVPGATVDDVPTNIAAIRSFVRACTVRPLEPDDHAAALCWNMLVPPAVRLALVSREIDSDDVLASLDIPVLMTHGEDDTVVLPAMGRRILEKCRVASASWYPGTGHIPFMEDAPRFNRELAAFVRSASRMPRGRGHRDARRADMPAATT